MEGNTIGILLSVKQEKACETPVVLVAGKHSLLLNKTLSGALLFFAFYGSCNFNQQATEEKIFSSDPR